MKIAVIIIVILGSLLTAGLGAKWIFDYNDNKQTIESLKDTTKQLGIDDSSLTELEKYKTNAYVLIACGLVGLISVFLIGKLGKYTAIIMLAAGIVPAFRNPGALIVTFLLVLGGILCFFIKPKTVAA